MSAVQGAMLGVSATLLLAVVSFLGWKAWGWMVGWYNLMLRGVKAAEAIQQELAYMRGLTGGTIGEQQVGGDPNETFQQGPQPVAPRQPRAHVPFPDALMEKFPSEPVPDAKLEDTDMDLLHQDDRDLAAMEVLEKMRQRGIEVEDSDTVHPGIVADSK